jgi:hypothetical protein
MVEELRLLRKRGSEHPLGRLYRYVEKHKEHLLDDEQELIEREAELERFQPTITRMEQTYPKPPPYNYGSYFQSPAYQSYKKYVDEKKRLEGNVEYFKINVETRKDLIREGEEEIQELESPGQDKRDAIAHEQYLNEQRVRVRSAQIVNDEIEKRNTKSDKKNRSENNPLQRLSHHGPPFMTKFKQTINGFAGTNSPFGGRTRRKRIKK